MTQYEQVVIALKKIGGKGTVSEILNAIPEDHLKKWKTETPKNTVWSILSLRNAFVKEKTGVWVYSEVETPKKPVSQKPAVKTATKGGLYLIAFTENVKSLKAGFVFKVGMTNDKLEKRLWVYNAHLPIQIIQTVATYPVPDGVNAKKIEEYVRIELLNNDAHGFSITKCEDGHQREWLQAQDINKGDQESINKLAKFVKNAVNRAVKIQKTD